VTRETRSVLGVDCTVARDTVLVDGHLEAATIDWYAQDRTGNAWYFGEDSKEFGPSGDVISTEGSWEATAQGAQPGIVMEAHPGIGDTYRQEYLKDVAEDQAQVIGLVESTTVPCGSYTGCVETKEWTVLNEGVIENKFYARGIGMVQAIMVAGGTDHSELASVATE